MQIIGIEEVKSISNQQEEMRKRKFGQQQPAGKPCFFLRIQILLEEAEGGDMSEETEKQRKKREKTEEQEKKKCDIL